MDSLHILLFVSLLFGSAEQKTITAESGQNITLKCRAPNNNIIVVKWSRTDLKPEYVLLYRDQQFDPENQHPYFKNRVDLQDRQMKDGDVSVILKNVTGADNGTYVCRIFMDETRSWRSSIIYLRVVDPPGSGGGTTEDGGKEDGGKEDGVRRGRPWLIVSGLLFLLLVAALLIAGNLPKKNLSQHLPPDEPADSCSVTIV